MKVPAMYNGAMSVQHRTAGPTACSLEFRLRGGSTRQLDLVGSAITVGRAADCGIVLDHPSVSRKHCEFSLSPLGRWQVRDLGSRYGTTLNGSVITSAEIKDRDVVGAGDYTIRISLGKHDTTINAAEDESADMTLSSLSSFQPPRIAAEHISSIMSFGRALQRNPDPADRLRSLLIFAVGSELQGWWAYALRVKQASEKLDIVGLCEPAASDVGKLKEPRISKSLLRAAITSGGPVVANSTTQLPKFQAEVTLTGDSQPFSAVACPLRKHAHGTDILYVIQPPRMGSVEWLTLIALAGEQYEQAEAAWAARAAAEQRAALERELNLARKVQARTVPQRGGADPIDWAVAFQPCLSVGGDYVDMICRADGKVLLIIADVSGKGMHAALVTAALHAVTHTSARSGCDLLETMVAANRHLNAFLPGGSFVTAVAMLLDPKTRSGACINCGHPPVFAASTGAIVREIPGGENPPLGILEDAPGCDSFELSPGEWIVLYTDGLTEMRNPSGEMLGIEPLRKQVGRICAAKSTGPATEFADELTRFLDAYHGEAMADDDRTFLVARMLG
jgi:sigma-B regulation protein RsbU (phosphoserine phosphatase)